MIQFMQPKWMNTAERLVVFRSSTPGAFKVGRTSGTDERYLYIESLATSEIMRNNLTFRELAEFKLARARGDFKEIGVT